MAGGVEAAGDIATGALIARAVEPSAGEFPAADAGALCLNCGTALAGAFCHRCGQAGHVHNTLTSIGHDILHGAFHFEGKIWRTLPMLITQPGALTRRYIAGERARFVSPLALFLFCIFLMFAVIHATAGELSIEHGASAAERSRAIAAADAKIVDARKDLAAIERRHRADPPGPPAAELTEARSRLGALSVMRTSLTASKSPVSIQHVDIGWPALDRRAKRLVDNPDLALFKLQSNAYKFSWALIPISVPFVALLFLWRRRFRLFDHAIFVTYSLDFMSLFVVAVALLEAVGVHGWPMKTAVLVVPPFHIYKQLRGAYQLRRFSAVWRTGALVVFALFALIAFAAFLLLLGIVE